MNISGWANCHDRLQPETWPVVKASKKFPASSMVMTMGSCFARNIEEHLARLGFTIPTLSLVVPKRESAVRSNDIINKYTPPSIFQEIQFTADIYDRDGVVTFEDLEKMSAKAGDEYIDLQLKGLVQVSKERLVERRQEIYDVHKHMFSCDLFVITLGLVEAWKDNETNMYIQQAPSNKYLRKDKERFQFEVLSHAQCLSYIENSLSIIRERNPNVSFLMTTSPVPLGRTFTDDDVIVANMHSKSKLRSVCGELSSSGKIDYFPSYESVMLTKAPTVWNPDLIHVSDTYVGNIVQRLVDVFFSVQSEVKLLFQRACSTASNEEALSFIQKAIEIEPLPEYLLKQGEIYQKLGNAQLAADSYRRALDIDATSWESWHKLSIIEERLGNVDSALDAVNKAMELCEDVPGSLYKSASRIYSKVGDEASAKLAMQRAYRVQPGLLSSVIQSVEQLSAAGNVPDAISLLKSTIEQAEEVPRLYILLGNLLKNSNDLEGAKEALEKAVALDPTLPGPHIQLSRTYGRLGDSEGAIREARNAIALKGDNPNYFFHLGNMLDRAGDLKGAEEARGKGKALAG
ncbi:GSCFA domain-containing protein [Pseudodesulfovibrio indicus]|uniref:GSCFA domain-containing protein n=1 Tax=Pseudodesulfovibrio indicus TaxID=1716143 RepID=UPI00292FFA2C|nr:GSCFA domain-containing protein [Pseudodesulfovibrio indicus]